MAMIIKKSGRLSNWSSRRIIVSVLVVTFDVDLVSRMADQLTRLGETSVDVATSVREAQHSLHAQSYDLVLLDLDALGDSALALITEQTSTDVVAIVSRFTAALGEVAIRQGARSWLFKATEPGHARIGALRRAPFGSLTEVELRILRLVAEGTPDAEIAKALGTTLAVTKSSLVRIRSKFGVTSRAHLVGEAIRLGLVA